MWFGPGWITGEKPWRMRNTGQKDRNRDQAFEKSDKQETKMLRRGSARREEEKKKKKTRRRGE